MKTLETEEENQWNDTTYTPEEKEFLRLVDDYKRAEGVSFLKATEYLALAKKIIRPLRRT